MHNRASGRAGFRSGGDVAAGMTASPSTMRRSCVRTQKETPLPALRCGSNLGQSDSIIPRFFFGPRRRSGLNICQGSQMCATQSPEQQPIWGSSPLSSKLIGFCTSQSGQFECDSAALENPQSEAFIRLARFFRFFFLRCCCDNPHKLCNKVQKQE